MPEEAQVLTPSDALFNDQVHEIEQFVRGCDSVNIFLQTKCSNPRSKVPDEGLDLEVEVSTGKDLGDGLINERNHRHIIFREYAAGIVGLQLYCERIKVIFG